MEQNIEKLRQLVKNQQKFGDKQLLASRNRILSALRRWYFQTDIGTVESSGNKLDKIK